MWTTEQTLIEQAFEERDHWNSASPPLGLPDAIDKVITGLDQGILRVAEKIHDQWVTHQWLKKAVLLSFRLQANRRQDGGFTQYWDKVDSKFRDYDDQTFTDAGFRVVPPATARRGSYIGRNVVLMPSYVNIGAYVDDSTMVDTWATVGSCAQIGKHVHLSGGVGIGGVLEPIQASPTIIEDHCFIGARSEIVEGVIVGTGSVISIGGSTSDKAPRFMIAKAIRSVMVMSLLVQWWFPGLCPRLKDVPTSIVPSSSKKSMPRRAPKPVSTSCCGAIDDGPHTATHRFIDPSTFGHSGG